MYKEKVNIAAAFHTLPNEAGQRWTLSKYSAISRNSSSETLTLAMSL
jgi:hypothetical protein